MATLQEIRTKADTRLTQLWSVIVSKQDAYFAIHGTYFGFKWSPSLSVVDGVDTQLGEINRPSRFHVAADVSFPTDTEIPFQIMIIRHHGPAGHGFTAWVRVELLDGRVYTRSKGYGAYGEDNPWQLITE